MSSYLYQGYYGTIVKRFPSPTDMSTYLGKTILVRKSLEVYRFINGQWVKQVSPTDFIFITESTFKIYTVSNQCSHSSFYRLKKAVVYRDLIDYQFYLVNSMGRTLNNITTVIGENRGRLEGAVQLGPFTPGTSYAYSGIKFYVDGIVTIPAGALVVFNNCEILFRDRGSIASTIMVVEGGSIRGIQTIFESASILKNRVGGIIIQSNSLPTSPLSGFVGCTFTRLGRTSDGNTVYPITINGTLTDVPSTPSPAINYNIELLSCGFSGDNQYPCISVNNTSVVIEGNTYDTEGSIIRSNLSILAFTTSNTLFGGTLMSEGIFELTSSSYPSGNNSLITFGGLVLLKGVLYNIPPGIVVQQNAPLLGLTGSATSTNPVTVNTSVSIPPGNIQYLLVKSAISP